MAKTKTWIDASGEESHSIPSLGPPIANLPDPRPGREKRLVPLYQADGSTLVISLQSHGKGDKVDNAVAYLGMFFGNSGLYTAYDHEMLDRLGDACKETARALREEHFVGQDFQPAGVLVNEDDDDE